jgi:hypothetical protein
MQMAGCTGLVQCVCTFAAAAAEPVDLCYLSFWPWVIGMCLNKMLADGAGWEEISITPVEPDGAQ